MKKLTIAVMALMMATAIGCQKMQGTAEETATDEAAKTTEAAMPSVSAPTVVVGDKSWTVEVAATPDERIKGLGGRDSLASDAGMWFIFPEDSTDPFWMKDTNFDLDMVFVGADMKIVDVKPGNKAQTEDLIQPSAPYRYVLEVPAGDAAGLTVGTVVDYRMGPQ